MITTLPHTVTVVTPGETENRYGDTVEDWEAGSTEEEMPGWVQHRSSTTQVGENRAAVVTTWMLIVGPEAPIVAGGRVVWEGRTFRIVGEPHQLTSPAGVHHIEAQLETVDG